MSVLNKPTKQQVQMQEQPLDNTKEKEKKNNTSNVLKLATAKTVNTNSKENEKRTKNGKFTLAQLRQTEGIVPLQSGTNQYDSQKGMTSFGMPRDVKGKHLKQIWELEFPDEVLNDKKTLPVNNI